MNSAMPISMLALFLAAGPAAGNGPEAPREEQVPEENRRMARPGLVADRIGRTVRIEAAATGVAPGTETEFFLIAPKSGHDYEAVAVSRAMPGDVHAALEFIGMTAGRPVHYDRFQFWPKGERVVAWIETRDGRRMRLEDTILDTRANATLPREGFVFVGSVLVPPAADMADGPPLYAADHFDPHAIITAFNLRTTVLDIPRSGSQSDLYRHQVAHEGAQFEKGEPLSILLEPERREGPPRVLTLRLEARFPDPDTLAFDLTDCRSVRILEAAAPDEVERVLRELHAGDRDLFVEWILPPRISLEGARRAARFLDPLVRDGLLRPEPPPEDGFYYRAFLSHPDMLRRNLFQPHPWILRFAGSLQDSSIRMIRVTTVDSGDGEFQLQEDTFDAGDPEEAARIARDHPVTHVALVVFAPRDLSLETARERLAPLLAVEPKNVFFFLE